MQIIFLLLSLIGIWRNAPQQTTESHQLLPGVGVDREFRKGEEHQYQIDLTAGHHVRIQILKHGISLTASLNSPDGKEVPTAVFTVREHGADLIDAIAQFNGSYILKIKPRYGVPPSSRYRVTIDELRPATEQDQRRFKAQLMSAEADRLYNLEAEQSRREALKVLTEALELWRSLEDRVWEARTLLQMGWNYYWLRERESSISRFNAALELSQAERDGAGQAEALQALGSVFNDDEERLGAIEALNQALILHKALNERWHVAGVYFELAKSYRFLFDNEKVIENYLEARKRYHEVGDSGNEAIALADIGMLQIAQGDYQEALNSSQRSLELCRIVESSYCEGVALHHIGDVYRNLGDQRKALDAYKLALPVFRESGDAYAEAYILLSMGISHGLNLDYSLALEHLKQAQSLSQKAKDRRGESGALRMMGKMYHELGDFQKAREVLNQSLELSREVKDISIESGVLASLGETHTAMRDYQGAYDLLTRALPLSRRALNGYAEVQSLYALAVVEKERGNLPEARARIEEAIRILELKRSKVAGYELRASYLAAQQGSYELYIDLLMQLHEKSPDAGHNAAALQASERSRARALLESLREAGADIRQGGDPALLDRERSLQKQLSAKENRRFRLLSGKHTPEQEAEAGREVEQLLGEYQQLQAQIRISSPRYAALTQPQPLNVKEIQAQLDPKTLLLVYSLGAKRSFLWAVTPDTLRSYVLPDREKIENQSRQIYQWMRKPPRRKSRGRFERQLREFSQLLLEPAAEQLPGKRLVIVADGALQYIPFAALTSPGSGRRLTAAHEIVNLPSVSTLGVLRAGLSERKPATRTLAVFADPVFDEQDQRLMSDTVPPTRIPSLSPFGQDPLHRTLVRSAETTGVAKFSRLTYSRREADQITAFIPPAMVSKMVDFDASRAMLFRMDLSQYRIVHFATHGLLNNQNPELSGVVLSLYDEQGQPQNGFIQTHEIYNLKLGADLIVLSACQTALGKQLGGEGIIGLARGFLYAGAPSLVVSLWKVDDLATAELMKEFYRAMILENLRPAAALRKAQAAMAQNSRYSAPYYWAGFVLQGEWK